MIPNATQKTGKMPVHPQMHGMNQKTAERGSDVTEVLFTGYKELGKNKWRRFCAESLIVFKARLREHMKYVP